MPIRISNNYGLVISLELFNAGNGELYLCLRDIYLGRDVIEQKMYSLTLFLQQLLYF